MPRILSSRILTSSFLICGTRQLAGDVLDQLARELELGPAPERMLAARVEQRDRVVVARRSRPARGCATISGSFFFARLAFAFCARFSLSAAKPTQNGGFGSAGDPGEDVRVLLELERQVVPFAFLIFCAEGFLTR